MCVSCVVCASIKAVSPIIRNMIMCCKKLKNDMQSRNDDGAKKATPTATKNKKQTLQKKAKNIGQSNRPLRKKKKNPSLRRVFRTRKQCLCMFPAADTSARFAGLHGVVAGSTTNECSNYFCWQTLLRWVGPSRMRCARLGCLQSVCWCTCMFF